MTIHGSSDLIREIEKLSAVTPDPAEVSAMILAALTPEEALAVAKLTLPNYVRLHMVRHRSASSQKDYVTAGGAATPSAHVAAMRDWLDSELARSVCVDARKRSYKRLSDCTKSDMLSAAQSRHATAARIAHRGDQFFQLAMKMEQKNVDTVGELPRAVLEEILPRP